MMELYLESDVRARFQIYIEPEVVCDGMQEKKIVHGRSIETELSTKFLRNFNVNTGLSDSSQEYFVGYYDDEEFIHVNLDPLTELPIDYPVVKCKYAEQLREKLDTLSTVDLNVDEATGLIQNQEIYEVLNTMYQTYPRLSRDIVPGAPDNPRMYLNVVESEATSYGYEVYVGHEYRYNETTGNLEITDEPYRASYLLDGIEHLISYYKTYASQLSILDLACENAKAMGWTIGDVPDSIAGKRFTFSVENQDLLSFLKATFSQTAKVLVDFDRIEKKINLIDVEHTDEDYDTGIFLTFRNLMNSVEITSSAEEGVQTLFVPKGQDDLGITYVNFGEEELINLDWFMDRANEVDSYQYVSKELHDKYYRWKRFREEEPYDGYESRRAAYRELSKLYNQKLLEINAEMNRLPLDACSIDYKTYPFQDLNLAYKAYMNALETLEKLYMSDVGAAKFNRDTLEIWDANGNLITDPDKQIKQTFYWADFDCYWNTIIFNVMNALRIYVWTPSDGSLNPADSRQMDAATGDWIAYPGGNPWYKADATRVTEADRDAYKYDMSLYGISELQFKQKAWRDAAGALYKVGFVLKNGSVVDRSRMRDIPTTRRTVPDGTDSARRNRRLSPDRRRLKKP